ncbi:hypothetical protein HDU91_000475 [Kappamyces sp. JEL0680]|nr:hypothetical protein HDU91_000475 [Kappamyces sp. JEL0680]
MNQTEFQNQLQATPYAAMLSQHPIILQTAVVYSLTQLAFFLLLRSLYPTVMTRNSKAASWIVGWTISTIMSSTSPILAWKALSRDLAFLSSDIAYALATCFLCSMIIDLVLGVLFYPQRVDVLTGWVHHIIYTGIILEFMRFGIPGVLGSLTVIEIPTLLLALGNINKKWRTNLLFGFCFFTTRVVYHAWVIFDSFFLLSPSSRFFWFMAIGWPLHIHWFLNWFRKSRVAKHKQQ